MGYPLEGKTNGGRKKKKGRTKKYILGSPKVRVPGHTQEHEDSLKARNDALRYGEPVFPPCRRNLGVGICQDPEANKAKDKGEIGVESKVCVRICVYKNGGKAKFPGNLTLGESLPTQSPPSPLFLLLVEKNTQGH